MNQPYVIYLDEVDSTNRYALEFFHELPDATLVAARVQHAGRGRLNRRWESPPDENIYASFIMKNLPDANWQYAAMASSLAVLELLREEAPGISAWLKWPNDVLCADRKICGMLGEIKSGTDNKPAGIVAGVGVNINMPPEALAAIDQPAASLLAETGKQFNVKQLTEKLAAFMNKYYSISVSRPRELYEQWRGENRLIGRQIVLETGDRRLTGTVLDLDERGGMVFGGEGKHTTFYSGDVRIDRESIAGILP
jgi:BirA family biotin operon repressor/biotin-[acetyl-CoA-carboxylase] ligase